MKIIGISGTNGSGKDSLGQFLADEHGWLFVSVTEILRGDLKQNKLPVTRENLRELSTKWRRENGLAVLIDKALAIFEPQKTKYRGLVIASVRNAGEADRLHELGGRIIWVDAADKVRYERIQKNAHLRDRSGEDNKTFKQFLDEEQAEMYSSGGDEATLNMAGVKAKADIFINNDSNDLEDFKKVAQTALKSIL